MQKKWKMIGVSVPVHRKLKRMRRKTREGSLESFGDVIERLLKRR